MYDENKDIKEWETKNGKIKFKKNIIHKNFNNEIKEKDNNEE